MAVGQIRRCLEASSRQEEHDRCQRYARSLVAEHDRAGVVHEQRHGRDQTRSNHGRHPGRILEREERDEFRCHARDQEHVAGVRVPQDIGEGLCDCVGEKDAAVLGPNALPGRKP